MKAKQVTIKDKSLKINSNESNWKHKEDTEKKDKSRRRTEEKRQRPKSEFLGAVLKERRHDRLSF